jgi:Brp/Blh family beta-carotene 15,15'-monooxygenase
LIFGVPHGSLDIEVLRNQYRYGTRRIAAVLLLYVGIAAAMYLLWQVAPIAALAAFLVTAVVHFSEDWDDVGSAFLAQGMSVALLTAPAFLHLKDMQSLFIALSGRQDAALLGDIMLLLAPVGLAVSAIALLSYWQSGRAERAGAGIAVIAGMALLPPAVGFAAFFCLYHSPRHFREALTHLSADQFRRRWRVVVPLSLAALGMAGWLFVQEARSGVLEQVVAASFMTLSILTVPHMTVPAIVAFFFRERGAAEVSLQEPSMADQGSVRVPAQG